MKTLTKILAVPLVVVSTLISACTGNYSPSSKMPEQDLESQLRAKYGCVVKVEIPNSKNMGLARSAAKSRAEKAYLVQCVKSPTDANFSMVDVAYDFENGVAYGFGVK
jgi:hypothetical protein